MRRVGYTSSDASPSAARLAVDEGARPDIFTALSSASAGWPDEGPISVDLVARVFTVHETKFCKSRLVPAGEQLAAALASYRQRRADLPMTHGTDSAFFASRAGHRIDYQRVVILSQHMRAYAGIQHRLPAGAALAPRLHDLRHTAAVHRALSWYREGRTCSSCCRSSRPTSVTRRSPRRSSTCR